MREGDKLEGGGTNFWANQNWFASRIYAVNFKCMRSSVRWVWPSRPPAPLSLQFPPSLALCIVHFLAALALAAAVAVAPRFALDGA